MKPFPEETSKLVQQPPTVPQLPPENDKSLTTTTKKPTLDPTPFYIDRVTSIW